MGSMGMAQPVRGDGNLYPGLDDTMHLGGVQVSFTLAGGEHRGVKTGIALESK